MSVPVFFRSVTLSVSESASKEISNGDDALRPGISYVDLTSLFFLGIFCGLLSNCMFALLDPICSTACESIREGSSGTAIRFLPTLNPGFMGGNEVT